MKSKSINFNEYLFSKENLESSDMSGGVEKEDDGLSPHLTI